ncbi:MAG: serine hydrolase domain-containing protein [Verrucomicrobiota bacterium]
MNLDRLRDHFEKNFSERGELGASVSVFKDGEEILTLSQGFRDRDRTLPWDEETLVPVWSATKGPAAVTFLMVLDEAGLRPGDAVSKVWPELRAARGGLTFGQLLCHQSGLPAIDESVSTHVLQHRGVVAALEQQEPAWEPGKDHGYHPRTIGFLLEEIVRRLSSAKSFGEIWIERLARNQRIDFWIGKLDADAVDRIATMIPPKVQRPTEAEIPFYRSLAEPDSLARRAFASPGGMRALSDINGLEYLQAGFPAFGGVGSAKALAQFYQILAQGGFANGVEVIPKAVMDAIRVPGRTRLDQTLLLPTQFTGGLMRDPVDEQGQKSRDIFGPSLRALGQPGAGGSHAFADPEHGISFAYVMNQMEAGILPNEKSLGLVDALYDDL